MLDFKLISGDCHITEHPDAFVRCQKEFGDKAPRVVDNPEGLGKGLWFLMEGLEPMRVGYFSLGHVVDKPEGRRNMSIYDDGEKFKKLVSDFRENYRYEDYPQDWEPSAYCKELDRDNVEAMIIFASWARYNYHLEDAKLQRSIFRSYNDWILEFASHAPRRIFPAPMISILDIDNAVADMKDYVKRGCKTVHLPTTIMGSGYYEPIYEPLWRTAVELDIPLTVHSNSSQGRSMKLHGMAKRKEDPREYVIRSEFEGNRFGGPMAAWAFVSNLIFSGVFDRYPSLKVCCSEFQMADAATVVESVDYRVGRLATYDRDRNLNQRWPSEYLRENVFMDFEDSRATVLTTPFYGEDNFYWSSDYPHFQTVWPRSASIFEGMCEGIKPDVMRKLGRDNVNQIYKLGLN
jgi:predicted TIM-barrel fold metal-dependent hydrolase